MIHKIMHSVVFAIVLCVLTTQSAKSDTLSAASSTVTVASPVLNVQFTNEPTQYDPLLVEDGVGLWMMANTVGTLYEYDGRGTLQKALVESMSLSRDKKHYSFKFKKGLKWSDGTEFKADHFVLAIQRLVNEPVKAATIQFIPGIDLSKTRAIDNRTAEVQLKDPDALFLNWLTLPALAPIRQDMIDAYKKRPDPVQPTLAAYRVTDYKREDYVSLKKNPEYYNVGAVNTTEVKIRFIKDESSLLPLLKAGSLDILFKVPALQVDEIKKVATVYNGEVEAVTYFGFNVKKPPFDDKKNRQLVRDALYSKKEDLAKVLKTDELPALFLAPPVLWARAQSRTTPPPPSKTAESIEFSAQSDMNSRTQAMYEFTQNELKKQLGWKMKLDMLDWKTHYAKLKSDPDPMFRFGWLNPVSDPWLTYQIFQGNSINNFTGWSNEQYDKLLAELRQENRAVKKMQLMRELEDIVWDEAPGVPMLHQVMKFAYSKRVSGFRSNSFGAILFREIRLR
ncbi:MAG: peptide ABC transporter substrate-binding protein [Bdellovibrionales bacterium]|nr:peptide ABC transporter substrate-binding protein [Bdellovibrionales bacterium]